MRARDSLLELTALIGANEITLSQRVRSRGRTTRSGHCQVMCEWSLGNILEVKSDENALEHRRTELKSFQKVAEGSVKARAIAITYTLQECRSK